MLLQELRHPHPSRLHLPLQRRHDLNLRLNRLQTRRRRIEKKHERLTMCGSQRNPQSKKSQARAYRRQPRNGRKKNEEPVNQSNPRRGRPSKNAKEILQSPPPTRKPMTQSRAQDQSRALPLNTVSKSVFSMAALSGRVSPPRKPSVETCVRGLINKRLRATPTTSNISLRLSQIAP